jgi:lipopolysaccharide export system permease protein
VFTRGSNLKTLKTLSRRLLVDFLGPFFLALFVLTFILLMDRLFLLIDLLVRKGIGFAITGELVLLSLPFTLSMSMPLAMLVAAVMSYGRASQDNEIDAIRTAGIQVFRVLAPVLIASGVIAVAMVYFNGYVVPNSGFRLRDLMMDLAAKRPAIRLESGVFNQDFEGYTIYIGTLNERTAHATDIRIYDRTKGGIPDLIVAPKGIITVSPDEKYLTLTLDSGSIHQYLGEDKYRRLEFNEHTINLPYNDDLVRQQREYRGTSELGLRDLVGHIRAAMVDIRSQQQTIQDIFKRGKLGPGDSIRLDEERTKLRFKRRDLDRLKIEQEKRYSLAFSCFLFLVFGAPLGILLRRGGLGMGFLVGLLFFALYYVLLLLGQEMADAGHISPFLGMWIANIILLPVTIELCTRTFFEYSFVTSAGRWIRAIFRKPRALKPQPG